MAEFIYALCATTSVSCAVLLIRSYMKTRVRLLLWSSLCFVGLALNNVLLFVDLVVVSRLDLQLLRTAIALGAVIMLLIGLIWEAT